jgi:hypothetical protein
LGVGGRFLWVCWGGGGVGGGARPPPRRVLRLNHQLDLATVAQAVV